MVQRLSVSISDELYERLEPLKDYMNVSGICAQAINNHLDLLERATIDNNEMGKAVRRLLDSKSRAEDAQYLRGFEQGRSYMLNDSTWEDLLIIDQLRFSSIPYDLLEDKPGSWNALILFSRIAVEYPLDPLPFVKRFDFFVHYSDEDWQALTEGGHFPEYAMGVRDGIIQTAEQIKGNINTFEDEM